jgi:SNF2 family DNA or RNA helicase
MPTEKASTAAAKVPFTVDYVRDLLEHEDKVIIYTDHTEAGKKLATAFNVPLISGEMVPAERTRVADHFRKNKTSRVLVATLGSFSTGVNLIECTQMVFNDFPWVPGTIEQAKYRINRLGQTRVCTYHYVLGSIQDGYILNTIMNKTKTIKEALE